MELYFIDSIIHILTQVSIYSHLTFCGAMASTTSCKSGDLPVGLSGCQIFLFKRVFCSRIMFGSRIAFSRICLNSMGKPHLIDEYRRTERHVTFKTSTRSRAEESAYAQRQLDKETRLFWGPLKNQEGLVKLIDCISYPLPG